MECPQPGQTWEYATANGYTMVFSINDLTSAGVCFKFNGFQVTITDGDWADLQALGRLRRVS